MQDLVEDFLTHLRLERGQSELTAKTYAALLGKFTACAEANGIGSWREVDLKCLMGFLETERERVPLDQPKKLTARMSSESIYLQIAALRAFYKYAENEKLLPVNVAENLSLPRRWKRLPKALTNKPTG